MKKIGWALGVLIVLLIIFYSLNAYIYKQKQGTPAEDPVTVTPISHATAVLTWDGTTIYTDPTGGAAAFSAQPPADIIVVTDIHGDHLNAETLSAVSGDAVVIVPQAVKDQLPMALADRVQVLGNNETTTIEGFSITGIPMYNLPESPESRHVKGRGNGYVIEHNRYRVYIAGDTAGTPEIRSLQNIDIAFIPMNLPFTMSVEEAADAVLDFKPKTVYPFHYRGQDGLSDTAQFKALVEAGDPAIEVVLLDWYPS